MKKIKLTQNQFALVDDKDYEWLNQWKWYANLTEDGFWYARRIHHKKGHKNCLTIRMHRFILNAPKGVQVDHQDRNSLNNQRTNLRFANNSKNKMNNKKYKNNTSDFKGVSLNKRNNKWLSCIRLNKKRIWLGNFNTKEEAARVYDEAAKKLFKEFAVLNFPVCQ